MRQPILPRDTGFINVRPTMLDNADWYAPFIETFTNAALPWALIGAPHAYPEFPAMAEFGDLLAEYARR